MCFIQHFLSTSWVPGSSAHLWEEVVMRMKENQDPLTAKSLSAHSPFAFHHICTAFVEWLQQWVVKGDLRGPQQSHGSRWIDGGNSVRGTKLTSWIPSFLSGLHPPCHILLFQCLSLSMCSLDEVTHSIPAGARQLGDEGVRHPSGASILVLRENATFQAPTEYCPIKENTQYCLIL